MSKQDIVFMRSAPENIGDHSEIRIKTPINGGGSHTIEVVRVEYLEDVEGFYLREICLSQSKRTWRWSHE